MKCTYWKEVVSLFCGVTIAVLLAQSPLIGQTPVVIEPVVTEPVVAEQLNAECKKDQVCKDFKNYTTDCADPENETNKVTGPCIGAESSSKFTSCVLLATPDPAKKCTLTNQPAAVICGGKCEKFKEKDCTMSNPECKP